jgi:hypothetical protein
MHQWLRIAAMLDTILEGGKTGIRLILGAALYNWDAAELFVRLAHYRGFQAVRKGQALYKKIPAKAGRVRGNRSRQK